MKKKRTYFNKRAAIASYVGTKDFLTKIDGMPFMFRLKFALSIMKRKAGELL